jgi:hypothetical protein
MMAVVANKTPFECRGMNVERLPLGRLLSLPRQTLSLLPVLRFFIVLFRHSSHCVARLAEFIYVQWRHRVGRHAAVELHCICKGTDVRRPSECDILFNGAYDFLEIAEELLIRKQRETHS